MKKLIQFSISALCGVVLSIAPAWAALNSELTLVGTHQGAIHGNGRGGVIEVLSSSFNFSRPVSPSSGGAVGRLIGGELKITKSRDKATVALLNAIGANENFSKFILRAFKPDPTGQLVNDYTFELSNVGVAGFSETEASGSEDPVETVQFRFTKIQITDEADHTTSVIDLIAPGGVAAAENALLAIQAAEIKKAVIQEYF